MPFMGKEMNTGKTEAPPAFAIYLLPSTKVNNQHNPPTVLDQHTKQLRHSMVQRTVTVPSLDIQVETSSLLGERSLPVTLG